MAIITTHLFYLYDVTDDNIIGGVTISLPEISLTADEAYNAIADIIDEPSGTSIRLPEDDALEIANILRLDSAVVICGSKYKSANVGWEFDADELVGASTLISLPQTISNAGVVNNQHSYRLLLDKDVKDNNYFDISYDAGGVLGMICSSFRYDGQNYTIGGVGMGIGARVYAVGSGIYSRVAVLTATAITSENGFVSCALWVAPTQHFNCNYGKFIPDESTFDAFMGLYERGHEDEIGTDDPFAPSGYSDVGGGEGTFLNISDNIDIPSTPSLSAADTRFISLFVPSLNELTNLAQYMWTNPAFDISAWKKIFADPMDAILGLSIVPVSVPLGARRAISVGNISTDVQMASAANQYVEINCGTLEGLHLVPVAGTLDVFEYWGSYLDYEPYTKAEICLPYCGTHAISVDDIMNKSVTVVYHVDILSGACVAYIQCDGTVLYQFIGQCSASIPITGGDWTNMVNGVINIAGAIGSMVATGGASAPMAAGTIASTAVNSFKPSIEKSGSLSGAGGLMAIQKPYLILTRPQQALPKFQNRFMGYPSFVTRQLSTLSGYTEIESIHLENIPATLDELDEIENLLKSGVIL